MNEKLKQEYQNWWDNSVSGKVNIEHTMEYYMRQTAEHFYNLALEEVRKEVKKKRKFTPESEDGLQRRYAYDVVLDLIDLLIEELQTI